jgi:DNA-binding MarR family transcriptional regulator
MLPKLDPLLHSELRLAVISILSGVESADFTFLRQQTGATAGNLSVQLEKLTAADYITVEKGFKGRKPCTTCRITPSGLEAFNAYIQALQAYLPGAQK